MRSRGENYCKGNKYTISLGKPIDIKWMDPFRRDFALFSHLHKIDLLESEKNLQTDVTSYPSSLDYRKIGVCLS